MGISERITGRTAKELSPVAAALAAPLPANLPAALARVDAAQRALKVADEVRSEAESSEAKTAVEDELRAAQSALHRAYAKRDVADRLGDDGDAPTADEIAELELALRKAQAKVDAFAPTLDALAEEVTRRRAALAEAVADADAALQPWDDALQTAMHRQVQRAADLLGEAQAAERIRIGLGEAQHGPTLQAVVGADPHRGTTIVQAPEEVREFYRKMFQARRRA